MSSELFIRKKDCHSLDVFVASLPSIIGCDHWEQRQSSQYVQERYFRRIVCGVQITAAIADSQEFRDWDFWLIFAPYQTIVDDRRSLDGLADCVARTLSLHSYEVLRPLDGTKGSRAMRYQLNQALDVKFSERIKVEVI